MASIAVASSRGNSCIRRGTKPERKLEPQIADEERDTLIKAEISLITNLNSLQGGKKIPVLMRRELPRKHLVWRFFLLPLTRCGA